MESRLFIVILIFLFSCNGPEVKRDRFFNKGNDFLGKNELDNALKQYEEALRIDPGYSKAWNNKGIVYHKKDKYYDAVVAFDIAIQNEPNLTEAYYNRAQSYVYLGEYARTGY